MLKVAKTLATAALLAAALTGCEQRPLDLADFDYRRAHPLGAEARTATLTLELPQQPQAGLADRDAARLSQFVQDFISKGEGIMEVLVTAPSGSAAAGGLFADSLLRDLMSQGVKPGHISAKLATVENAVTQGTAVLRYRQGVAVVPDCGNWSENLQTDHRGANSPNHGCATQHNIGVMVANPRDLVQPRAMAPPPGMVGDRAKTRSGAGAP